MRLFREADVPKMRPCTAQFKPSLAYMLMTSPAQKRALAKFHQYRNYRERIGSPIKYYGSAVITAEMGALRHRIAELESAALWDISESIDGCLIALKSIALESKSLDSVVR